MLFIMASTSESRPVITTGVEGEDGTKLLVLLVGVKGREGSRGERRAAG